MTSLSGLSGASASPLLLPLLFPSSDHREAGRQPSLTSSAAWMPSTSGRLTVAGTEVGTLDRRQGAAFREANIGFIFQDFNLLPALTASLITIGVVFVLVFMAVSGFFQGHDDWPDYRRHAGSHSDNFGQQQDLLLEASIHPGELLSICGIVIIVSVLACLQPAFKASRMEPIIALRHV